MEYNHDTQHDTTTIPLDTPPKPKFRGAGRPFSKDNQPENRGRKPGSTNKLSIVSLLRQLSTTCGVPYEVQLAQNYQTAILKGNAKVVHAYDNLFLSKLLADKVSLEVAESQEIIDQKKAAFLATLKAYGEQTLIDAKISPQPPAGIPLTIVPPTDTDGPTP